MKVAIHHAADDRADDSDDASAFVFAIGLTFASSFERRRRAGVGAAYRHFVLRHLALIGIGAILTAGGTSVAGAHTDWGVLQALGLAGLICLAFIRLPAWARFLAGLLLLVGYQLALDAWWLEEVVRSSHGGFLGAISWAALLILATAVADLWRRGRAPYALCCAFLVVVAAISALVVPVSKHRVSLSFVLITLAISAVAFLVVDLASRAVPNRPGFLAWWGENSLALYILHLLVLAIVAMPAAPWWYAQAPGWLAAVQLSVVLAALSLAAWWLHRRGIRIAL